MCLTRRTTSGGNEDLLKSSVQLSYDLDDCLNESCVYLTYDEYADLSSSGQNLTILQMNIRGIIGKQNELTSLLKKGSENKISAVLLCETWLRKENINLLKIPGYETYSKERKGKGGGVCILLDEELIGKRREDLEEDSSIYENIVVEIKTDNDPILLVSAYRPPNTPQSEFIADYGEHIKKLQKKNSNIILGIDHNMDLLKCSSNRKTQEFLELNLEKRLLPCITKPSRITHISSTLIDNIFCSAELNSRSLSSLILTDISDHLPCMTVFDSLLPTMKEK